MGFAKNNELLHEFHKLSPEEIDPQVVYACKQCRCGIDLDTVLRQWKTSLIKGDTETSKIFKQYLSSLLSSHLIDAMEDIINL